MTWALPFARLLNPRPAAVGLEVGTSSLKVVELRGGTPPHLHALGMRPTPPGLLQDDHIVDTEGLAHELGALFKDAGINRRFVVTAVSNRASITRNIHMPKMPLKELQRAVPWEAERYIPFPLDEVAMDHYLLDNPSDVADGSDVEVVIAAARLDLVTQLSEGLKKAGLEPTVIDIKPFALLRALKGSLQGEHFSRTTLFDKKYTDEGDIGVVLEVGAASSTVTLVRGDRVVMNRNLGVAGDDFTSALQRAFGLDFDAAEEVKLAYGSAVMPSDADNALLTEARFERFSPVRVHEALRPVLSDLTTEVRRSLEFFRVQSGDASISQMFLAGGGAKLRGLPEAISRSLSFKVSLADPWLTVVPGERYEKSYLEHLAPEFGVPLGLALRGVTGLD
ncbi:MAG: Type IV pilus biogenesis protein PilM [uncultured Truepera sp.]|uniref:Type IV pilus biogenesis protein PilM n=1 Tax=uncultured Truepera sp. TaxID=543023 RepID=A0A6J4VUF0_9DEIN|nr:MAG: Type IV pilus biogenesis protein PilM [uncultured Truepera sp.]